MLVVRFETRLNPVLFGREELAMSTVCALGVQTADDAPVDSISQLQFGLPGGKEEEIRSLGWNEIEIETPDTSHVCVWLKCRVGFQVHPPYLCHTNANASASSVASIGTFNILPAPGGRRSAWRRNGPCSAQSPCSSQMGSTPQSTAPR
ncbi:hypothetical protein BASA81_001589 [Batrachochytrium salamandrivorans]|nr:hypothetical protein BASA81_001589 [Batrachochytrium salamandrivorans]